MVKFFNNILHPNLHGFHLPSGNNFHIPPFHPHINLHGIKVPQVIKGAFEKTKSGFLDGLRALRNAGVSAEQKVNTLVSYLNDKTGGVGASALMLLVPEAAIGEGILKLGNEIASGSPPAEAFKTIASSLIYKYALGQEINVLGVATEALGKKEVVDAVIKSKTGQLVINRLKNQLPENIRSKIPNIN